MEHSKWTNVSNEDFVKILRDKAQNKSWTISELFELEKRGFEILDGSPDLKKELEEIRNRQLDKIRISTKPMIESLGLSLNRIEKINRLFTPPKIPTLPTYKIPEISLQSVTGPVGQPYINSRILDDASNSYLVQQGMAHTLREILDANLSTVESLKKDPVFWAIFVFTGISAICAVVSVILALIHY